MAKFTENEETNAKALIKYAEIINGYRRPYLSAIYPETNAPIKYPIKTHVPKIPS